MPSSLRKKSRFLIYGLVDPRTDGVRYVGRSSSGMKRPKQHWRPSRLPKDPTHKGRWLRALKRQQRRKLSEAAKRWKRTPEHMEKLRQSRLGKPQSEYQKRRVSEVHTGKIVSQKTCELISKVRSVPVVDLDTKKVYPSCKVAEQELGLCPSSVSKVLRGKLRSIHGRRFAYTTKI